MDQVEAAAFRNFILGISENLDSGGTVAAIALQIGKDDYIVGVLGYQFVPGGNFIKAALGIAQALDDY
jgi:NH3-dependent NAD+ synthetase